jgi:hypothetical protein
VEAAGRVNINQKGTTMKRDGQTPEEAIRVEAYLLSEKAGHPVGMEAYFWQEAELIVAGRNEKPVPAKRLAAKGKPKAGAAAKSAAGAKAPKKKA